MRRWRRHQGKPISGPGRTERALMKKNGNVANA